MMIGDTVKWNHSNPDGWAGAGVGKIERFDPERRYFGTPVGSGNPGPAIEIRLEHNGLTQWLSPSEVDVVASAEAA